MDLSQLARPGRKAASTSVERPFKIAQSGRAGIQRREHVDEHDLPVEPGEMVAEEGLHDVRFVGLVAPLHHRAERVPRARMIRGDVERREGQGGRAFEIAGHQEPAGRQRGERMFVCPRLLQIRGEGLGNPARRLLVLRTGRVRAGELGMPRLGEARPGATAATRRAPRPTTPRRISAAEPGRAAIRRGNRRYRD